MSVCLRLKKDTSHFSGNYSTIICSEASVVAPQSPITVLVVDDHPVVREGLTAIISAEKDITVVGVASTAADAVAEYFKLRPNVVLMDLLLPDRSGVDAITQICAKAPGARIVVLTTLAGDEEIYRAIEAGARGYLLKDVATKELVQAIRQVNSGRRYIPADVGSRIAEGLPRPGLTSRELDVLRLIASGLRNKEAAYELNLSEGTVNAHIKHILSKLHATDRTHAVMVALRRGLIRI
jgi:DNA-binding NarL/FixJ family response regulator